MRYLFFSYFHFFLNNNNNNNDNNNSKNINNNNNNNFNFNINSNNFLQEEQERLRQENLAVKKEVILCSHAHAMIIIWYELHHRFMYIWIFNNFNPRLVYRTKMPTARVCPKNTHLAEMES